MAKERKGQLIAGLILLILGILFILDQLLILEMRISWPLILVAIGIGLFLSHRHTLGGWIVGGIGLILFVVNFAAAFFPGFESWSDLAWPIILILIGALLLYRFYHGSLTPKS